MRNRQTVLSEIKKAVQEERRSQIIVLELLREVERDRHFLEMGYPTLFEFATNELGYSPGAAHRRIQSMRLLKALPEMKEKIEDGELSLCVAARTQSFFRQEDRKRRIEKKSKLSLEFKQEVAYSMLGASTRECERKLVEISPESAGALKEKTQPLSDGKTLIQFTADKALMEKLEKLRELLAHQNFEGRFERLFEILADLALKKFDPVEMAGSLKQTPKRALKPQIPALEKFQPKTQSHAISQPKAQPQSQPQSQLQPKPEDRPQPEPTPHDPPPLPESKKAPHSRYIPASVKRAVWARDGGRCTFVDSQTGRRCENRHAVQHDHAIPFAWGGESSLENLRLRCSFHNAHAARQLGL